MKVYFILDITIIGIRKNILKERGVASLLHCLKGKEFYFSVENVEEKDS